MGYYHLRHSGFQCTVAVLAEVQHIGSSLGDHIEQKLARHFKVVFCLLHPFQFEGCRAIVHIAQRVDPLSLRGIWNVSKADERDIDTSP
jgi:hypothetical protein